MYFKFVYLDKKYFWSDADCILHCADEGEYYYYPGHPHPEEIYLNFMKKDYLFLFRFDLDYKNRYTFGNDIIPVKLKTINIPLNEIGCEEFKNRRNIYSILDD